MSFWRSYTAIVIYRSDYFIWSIDGHYKQVKKEQNTVAPVVGGVCSAVNHTKVFTHLTSMQVPAK